MLAVLFLGVLMGALDIAIVGPALPAIGRQFGADARQLAWVLTIFVLFNLMGTPLLARLSDLRGRRNLYIASVAVFAVGSAVAASADSLLMLLAGRALQGLGAGGVFPVATAVIGDVFPPERQGRALGMLGAVFGLAFLIGPILGGLLLPFGWKWLFWINLPVAALIIALAVRALPAARPAGGGQGFDTAGWLLLSAGLAALSVGTSALDVEQLGQSLRSPLGGPMLVVSVAGLAWFWRVQQRVADPLIDPAVVRNRELRIANGLSALAGVVEAGLVFVPSLIVAAFAVEPATASFMLLPAVLTMAVGSPLTGRLLDRHGARVVVVIGSLVLFAGLAVVPWATSSLYALLAAGIVVGFGLSGLIGAPLRYIVLREAGPGHRAAAQAANTLFRSAGRMIGGVLLGAIIASRPTALAGYHLAFVVLAAAVLAGAGWARGLRPGTAARAAASSEVAPASPRVSASAAGTKSSPPRRE